MAKDLGNSELKLVKRTPLKQAKWEATYWKAAFDNLGLLIEPLRQDRDKWRTRAGWAYAVAGGLFLAVVGLLFRL